MRAYPALSQPSSLTELAAAGAAGTHLNDTRCKRYATGADMAPVTIMVRQDFDTGPTFSGEKKVCAACHNLPRSG